MSTLQRRRKAHVASSSFYQHLDGRSAAGRLLRRVRKELTDHLGGKPSPPQRVLVDRAAWLTLHMAQIDARTAEGRPMTEHDSRTYLAWSNTLTRLMRQLGTAGVPQPPRTLAERRAERNAAR